MNFHLPSTCLKKLVTMYESSCVSKIDSCLCAQKNKAPLTTMEHIMLDFPSTGILEVNISTLYEDFSLEYIGKNQISLNLVNSLQSEFTPMVLPDDHPPITTK